MQTSPLPPLFARWLDQALEAPIPHERRAVCDPCAMCGPQPGSGQPYDPGVKCCSFWPDLPAFLVGQVLADTRDGAAAGKAVVRRFIAEDRCVTPLGIDSSPARTTLYDKVSDERFGVDPELLCPYFDAAGGRCHIWPHRNDVCATYFCLHERRAVGQRLWQALKELIRELERVLVSSSLLELAPDSAQMLLDQEGAPRALGQRELPGWVEPDGRLDADLARRIWGPWRGKEEDYFLACAERAREVDWAGLRAMGGVRLEALRLRAAAALRRHQDRALPSPLCAGLFEEDEPPPPGQALLQSEETAADPLPVPSAVAEALELFDGRPTAEAVRVAREEHDAQLDDALLGQLVDAGVLGAPDGADLPPRLQPDGPLEPDSRLRFFRGFRRAPVAGKHGFEEGQPNYTVSCGHKEIVFDEPELYRFGTGLYKHRHGFRAGDAAEWGELGWERVQELLQQLLEAGLLQRVPAGDTVEPH